MDIPMKGGGRTVREVIILFLLAFIIAYFLWPPFIYRYLLPVLLFLVLIAALAWIFRNV